MLIVDTLAPLILLIALGAALAHIRFLGQAFMADLNKLAFWIALPALLFRSAAHAAAGGGDTWRLLGVTIASTFAILAVAWAVGAALRIPRTPRGTLMQSAYRGNLAYIGIPVVSYSFADLPPPTGARALATAVVVMVLTMVVFNVLAVIVLQVSRTSSTRADLGATARSIALNPLLLAGLSGLLLPASGLELPRFADSTLESLGASAVPIALLCVGGSLATVGFEGRRLWIGTAAVLKAAVLPAVALGLSRLAGLGPLEERIALVFAASPTAVAAYIMVTQMDGDERLASGSITASTLLSAVTLAGVLWFTS